VELASGGTLSTIEEGERSPKPDAELMLPKLDDELLLNNELDVELRLKLDELDDELEVKLDIELNEDIELTELEEEIFGTLGT